MALSGTVFGVESGNDLPFEDVDFMSFVSHDTYGKPAIIAPGTDGFAPAGERGKVRVLYVNPSNVIAVDATKTP